MTQYEGYYKLDGKNKAADEIVLAQRVLVPNFEAQQLHIRICDGELGGLCWSIPHGIEAVVLHGVGGELQRWRHTISAGEGNLLLE